MAESSNHLSSKLYQYRESPPYADVGLEINRVKQNLCWWDCKESPTNGKIPNLCINKPKTLAVGSAVAKTV